MTTTSDPIKKMADLMENGDPTWDLELAQELWPTVKNLLHERGFVAGQKESMDDHQYRAFLDLMMCSDPWPDGVDQAPLEAFADEQAHARGHENWIVAFHEHLK